MQASIGGSARISGVGNVAGLQQSGNGTTTAVKAATLIWIGAFVVLVIFHVGGAHI